MVLLMKSQVHTIAVNSYLFERKLQCHSVPMATAKTDLPRCLSSEESTLGEQHENMALKIWDSDWF